MREYQTKQLSLFLLVEDNDAGEQKISLEREFHNFGAVIGKAFSLVATHLASEGKATHEGALKMAAVIR